MKSSVQISILIPVFNFDITTLAQMLKAEAELLEIDYEIIFLDDCSTNLQLVLHNKEVVEKLNLTYLCSDVNNGIAKVLNQLVNYASYNHLIFLDADVLPTQKDFLSRYINIHHQEDTVFCGGLIYNEIKPIDGILRWRYGNKYEVQEIKNANKNPYLNFKACNFSIYKSVFNRVKFESDNKNYSAVDTLFGFRLKDEGFKVQFIENRVVHLGLETNQIFLNKTNSAVESALLMYEKNNLYSFRLIDFYLLLEKYYLLGLVTIVLNLFQKSIKKNLLSSNPSVFLFQLYKLNLILRYKKANEQQLKFD